MDREKVIKGLWRCELIHRGATLEESCNVCPYQQKPGQTCEATELFHDARQLLKAQGPVEPDREHSGGGTTWWNVCGACRTAINPNDKYCHECGRAVRWT